MSTKEWKSQKNNLCIVKKNEIGKARRILPNKKVVSKEDKLKSNWNFDEEIYFNSLSQNKPTIIDCFIKEKLRPIVIYSMLLISAIIMTTNATRFELGNVFYLIKFLTLVFIVLLIKAILKPFDMKTLWRTLWLQKKESK